MPARVAASMPPLHSDAYTAFAWLCQKTTMVGRQAKTTVRMARASGSEKGAWPALTSALRHVALGCHLQSKLRLRSTSLALKRPSACTAAEAVTFAAAKRPVVPTTLYKPSGFADGITIIAVPLAIVPGCDAK